MIKSDFNDEELICDLVEGISLLGKNFFTKSIGIDPMLMKGFMPLLPYLLKDQAHPPVQIAGLKALGTFTCQACVAPIRMISFFKELVDAGIIDTLCQIVGTASNQASVTPLHSVSVHVLSILVAPFHGDTFSFPWKRNPLEGFAEHQEVMPQLEGLRNHILKGFQAYDWVSRLVNISNKEDINQ